MYLSSDANAVVIDNGSAVTKAGLAGDDAPRSMISTVVGRRRMPGILIGLEQKDNFVGEEALEKRGVLKLERPIQRGIIKDWDNMEKIWNYTITNQLKTTPEEQAILLTEPPFNSNENKEKMTQIMFETLNVPCLYIGIQTVLALYASGRYTGLVLDIGEGLSCALPIYEGFEISYAASSTNLAGYDITMFLRDSLRKRGYIFSPSEEIQSLQFIKENSCEIAESHTDNIQDTPSRKIEGKEEILPDGHTVVTLLQERFTAPEILFDPLIAGMDLPGIHESVDSAINCCELNLRKELYKNVILAGGSSLFKGIRSRLAAELNKIGQKNTEVTVLAPPERKYSAWIGGSIVASLSAFSSMYISRTEYNDSGASAIHRKF